jgi:hypothetical protein
MAATQAAIWCNSQTYKATQAAVAPAGQIDVAAYAAALDLALQNGTITDPVPAIQISYDATAQVQTLTCAGVLTNSMRGQLAGLIASPLLGTLLQSVRNQAIGEFQSLVNGLVAAAINDPDPFLAFAGVDPTKQQQAAKAELVKVFLPLLGPTRAADADGDPRRGRVADRSAGDGCGAAEQSQRSGEVAASGIPRAGQSGR